MNVRIALSAAVVAGLLAGCGGDEPATDQPPIERMAPAGDEQDEQAAEQPVADQPAPETLAAGPDAGAAAPADRFDELYTVQVAAFVNADSAAAVLSTLARRGLPVFSTSERIESRDFTRVRVGATPDLAEARRLGSWLTRQYGWPVWVAPVVRSDSVPADAVDGTRRFLRTQ